MLQANRNAQTVPTGPCMHRGCSQKDDVGRVLFSTEQARANEKIGRRQNENFKHESKKSKVVLIVRGDLPEKLGLGMGLMRPLGNNGHCAVSPGDCEVIVSRLV